MTRRWAYLFAASYGLLSVACGGGSNPVEPSPSGGDNSTTTAPCGIVGTSTSGPVLGLFSHTIVIGSTSDGLDVTGLTEVLPRASVPDGVVLPDGSVGIYYVDATTHAVWLGHWTGTTLVPVSAITIDGVPAPEGVVDPDATNLGGQVRLAYLSGFQSPEAVKAMCLADSTDGINFQSVSAAWVLGVGATQTDPSLVHLPSGAWLMAISDGSITRIGQSSNGLSFSQISTMTAGSVPELSLTADGRVRLHVCQRDRGIGSHVSEDGGLTWTEEQVVISLSRFPGHAVCDPSYVPSAGLFIFKVQRITDFGAFVEILPGIDGLLHVSEIAHYRVKEVRDEIEEGDQVMVKVINVDPSGKVRLSRKALLPGTSEKVD